MQFFLLDGVGGAFLLLFFGAGLLFLALAILAEAWIMQGMKYVASFKRALMFSLVANLVSLIAGFLLSNIDQGPFNLEGLAGWGLMFGVTVILEYGVLFGLNRDQPAGRTLIVTLLMNLATYLVALLFWLAFS